MKGLSEGFFELDAEYCVGHYLTLFRQEFLNLGGKLIRNLFVP